VSHGQAVSIVAVDAEAVQVELLEGPQRGRRAWVQPRHLGSLPSGSLLAAEIEVERVSVADGVQEGA
jgi:hypothetical protein